MSGLRSHFHSARSAYGSVSYPGDLSADVLGPIVPHHWYKWPVRLGFGGLAAAAAVAWAVLLSHPAVKPATPHPRLPENHEVAVVPRQDFQGLCLSPPAIPEMPEMPDLSSMPGMPAMPAGFAGPTATPAAAPSFFPDMIPMAPPGLPPAMTPAVSPATSKKEPA